MVGRLFRVRVYRHTAAVGHCRSCCICMAAVTFNGVPEHSAHISKDFHRDRTMHHSRARTIERPLGIAVPGRIQRLLRHPAMDKG